MNLCTKCQKQTIVKNHMCRMCERIHNAWLSASAAESIVSNLAKQVTPLSQSLRDKADEGDGFCTLYESKNQLDPNNLIFKRELLGKWVPGEESGEPDGT